MINGYSRVTFEKSFDTEIILAENKKRKKKKNKRKKKKNKGKKKKNKRKKKKNKRKR